MCASVKTITHQFINSKDQLFWLTWDIVLPWLWTRECAVSADSREDVHILRSYSATLWVNVLLILWLPCQLWFAACGPLNEDKQNAKVYWKCCHGRFISNRIQFIYSFPFHFGIHRFVHFHGKKRQKKENKRKVN